MRYVIFDNWNSKVLQSFRKKNECREWIMDGLIGCEGAERDHYVSMLQQLENGKKTICYWEE